MTDMLQKSENVAKNVANKNSQDLTEQWKKGELPEGFYYVNDGAEVTIDYYLCDYWERHFDWDIQQVLAPVPSYEEWFKIKNLASLTSLLQEKNIECLHRENKLKELLKKCQTLLYNNGFLFNPEDREKAKELLTKIDEVLK